MIRTGLLAWVFLSVPVSVIVGRVISAAPGAGRCEPDRAPRLVLVPGSLQR